MSDTKDIWAMLEKDAPAGCEAVQDLYSWSLNYDPRSTPFGLFLDLTSYSMDKWGDNCFDASNTALGYVEVDKLAKALTEYADHPQEVHAYCDVLIEAEMAS